MIRYSEHFWDDCYHLRFGPGKVFFEPLGEIAQQQDIKRHLKKSEMLILSDTMPLVYPYVLRHAPEMAASSFHGTL